jgi:glycosyltransferase involved in cell wall biosynthesis
MKIFFISEALSHPFDEGIKNVAFSLHKHLKRKTNSLSVTRAGNNTENLEIITVCLNKFFLNSNLRTVIKKYNPDVILYLPEASVTFNSFIRSKVLKAMNRTSRVVILGVKQAEYTSLQKTIIKTMMKPDLLLLLGKFGMKLFQEAGFKVEVLPPAVDCDRFCPAEKDEKDKIREEYNIPNNKKVVLHVGHIRATRNVEALLKVQEIDNVQVVIVGSTSTVVEKDIKERLTGAGIRVIDEFIPDISKMYKMSDIYTFPVINEIACIEMPLSVFEAMACNLPVITTRFGCLVENFNEDEGLKYFETTEELLNLIKLNGESKGEDVKNSMKIKSFTWGKFADNVIDACSKTV